MPRRRGGYASATSKKRQKENRKRANELSPEELEGQSGEPLPDREVMSILPITDPVNPAFLPQFDKPIPVPAE